MDQILLCSNHIPPVTTIYNSFIQNEMLDANGSYVKVYLYLSMCIQSGNTSFSISSLADQMENTEKDITRALAYWEKRGLILLHRDDNGEQITGIEFLIPAQAGKTERTEVKPEKKTEKREKEPEKPSVQITEEQSVRLSEDNDFIWIIQIVESFLERPLQSGEIQFLMYLFDNLGFSKELILYLYEYCCTLGKTNLKYVQAVAFSWAEKNIKTPEQAKMSSANYSAAHTAIAKAFGLNRTLGAIESQYINRWSNEWKFDLSVILEACSRTLLSIQKADFKYADRILSNWHKNGVHTLQDVRIYDENYQKKKTTEKKPQKYSFGTPSGKNQFQTFQQREVTMEDMDLLEKQLLSR